MKPEQGDLFLKPRRPALAKCRCCHHPLSDPASIARGVGPSCWARGGGERYQIQLKLEGGR